MSIRTTTCAGLAILIGLTSLASANDVLPPSIEACAALDIRTILCRQERVGVGIADGYTRIKRGKRNGVFAAQAGPGIENAFPGIAQAYAENVPILIIPSVQPLSKYYVRPHFRAAEVYRPVTKWSALAHNVQEVPDLMRYAYHAMRSGKPGPRRSFAPRTAPASMPLDPSRSAARRRCL